MQTLKYTAWYGFPVLVHTVKRVIFPQNVFRSFSFRFINETRSASGGIATR